MMKNIKILIIFMCTSIFFFLTNLQFLKNEITHWIFFLTYDWKKKKLIICKITKKNILFSLIFHFFLFEFNYVIQFSAHFFLQNNWNYWTTNEILAGIRIFIVQKKEKKNICGIISSYPVPVYGWTKKYLIIAPCWMLENNSKYFMFW